MNEFNEPVVLGSSGLVVRRMEIEADTDITANAIEWAFEQGIR